MNNLVSFIQYKILGNYADENNLSSSGAIEKNLRNSFFWTLKH